jgi:hypothetical protein
MNEEARKKENAKKRKETTKDMLARWNKQSNQGCSKDAIKK